MYIDLLGNRLLTSIDSNFNEELRNLELIKKRFGESNLHTCDGMLHDIKETDRINKLFKLTNKNLKVNVVSQKFWKQVEEEPETNEIKLPNQIAEGFQELDTNFRRVKPLSKLIFK